MTATIRYSAAAEEDLADISTYTEKQWGIQQAKVYLVAIADAIDRIALYPSMGSPMENVRDDYRKLRVESHNIYYRCGDSNVDIIRILHQRADHLSNLQ